MEIRMLSVPQSAFLRGALGLCLALSVPATLSAGAAQAQTKIIAGMVAHGPPQWPQYIATELGWLKQDNIELDFVTAGGGGAQQLAAGALDVCHSGYPRFRTRVTAGRASEDHCQRHCGISLCSLRQTRHQADRRSQ